MKLLDLKSIIREVISEIYDMPSTVQVQPKQGLAYGIIGTSENPGNKVQTALHILGIDPSLIYGTRHQNKGITYNQRSKVSGGFWSRGNEYYWNLLEMARNNYLSLVKKYHPDIIGPEGEQKTRELNTAWELIKNMFAKKGYELAE